MKIFIWFKKVFKLENKSVNNQYLKKTNEDKEKILDTFSDVYDSDFSDYECGGCYWFEERKGVLKGYGECPFDVSVTDCFDRRPDCLHHERK